jgi:hypothetical protein
MAVFIRMWSAAVPKKKALQKLYQTLQKKIYPCMSVLKLPLLLDLQKKVGALVLFVTFCTTIIILENVLMTL